MAPRCARVNTRSTTLTLFPLCNNVTLCLAKPDLEYLKVSLDLRGNRSRIGVSRDVGRQP